MPSWPASRTRSGSTPRWPWGGWRSPSPSWEAAWRRAELRRRAAPGRASGPDRPAPNAMTLPRLTREDVAILRLEAGEVAGHTLKLLVVDPPAGGPRPGVEDIRAAVAARLGAAPELRRRLAPTPLGLAPPAWVDDGDFAIERHVRRVEEPEPVSAERLRAIVARAMRERLDRAHPLWSLDVVEYLEDGGLALIWKLHHAMADGTASMRIGREVLWDSEPGAHAPAATPWRPDPAPGPTGLLAAAVQER